MPARRPEYLPGHYYHIYNRGAGRAALFRDQDNYLFVLRKMKHYSQALALLPTAYCLLPNHYHFLLRQDADQPAGLLPQRVFNSYSKRHSRTGTLFAGPYRFKAVRQESHLLHLCRYIHANPVIHGLVSHPANWPYSNYLEWVEQRGGTMVDREFVQAHFPLTQDYEAFVFEYIAMQSLPEELGKYLGQWEGW